MTPEEELEDLPVSKENRRRREEAERDRQIYNPPLLDLERKRSRKARDKHIALIVKKARKA